MVKNIQIKQQIIKAIVKSSSGRISQVRIAQKNRIKIAIIGKQGPSGKDNRNGINAIAKLNLSGQRVVAIDMEGKADYADCLNLNDAFRVIGLTRTSAITDTGVEVVCFGEFESDSWNWQTEKPIFLSQEGFLTQTPDTTNAMFLLQVGKVLSPTRIYINPRQPILLGN